ncbi:hypothetical protein [Halostagnicola sp. A-GB9-2]|uniref:DUF7344 domain-containing protein n=1 Tax=Halostagnicola sp. A-GB9-2 TaxID=3048066 RepID=UPI0024C0D85C|nr:hypothetical protein [Halostagnicola sp. A-GB9-2]MDJ1433885.1 hypothetical protein [Halostagnicola sp. A-GB9-2]
MSITEQQRPRTRSRSSTTPIDREIAYQALSNRRRRFTVHYLIQQWEPVTLRTLSNQVAAWENAVPRKQVTSKQRKRVYTALHQAHLPKLDKMGIIEYDTNEMVAHPTDNIETLRVYMDVVPEDEIPWSVFYTGIALSFGSSAFLGWIGLVPFSVIPGGVWAVLTASIIVAIGTVNIYRNRQNRLGNEGPPPEVAHVDPP